MPKDTPIFSKIYQLAFWLYPIVNKFPKSQRFVLGQNLENSVVRTLRLAVKANYNKDRVSILEEASEEVDWLLILIRFSRDLNFLSKKQYEFASMHIIEISKMVGGWIKYEKR